MPRSSSQIRGWGQRISELLKSIGTEEAKSEFLKAYYSHYPFREGTKVIIDSTSLINNVLCSFTAVGSHTGLGSVLDIMVLRKTLPEDSSAYDELQNDGFFVLISKDKYETDRNTRGILHKAEDRADL